MSKRDIYKPRDNRPYAYPEAIELMHGIQDVYWRHTEVNFNSAKQEIQEMDLLKREGMIRNLLCISTIEVAVKKFWTQLGNHFPVLEWDMLGVVAGESEVRHFEAYSHLLSVLNLEKRFEEIKEVPAIKGRFDYLNKYLKLSPNNSDPRKYIIKLILFSCLIEHTSLFGQFIPTVYYYRKWGLLKDVKNVIAWTAIDEGQHFQIGATIVNILREEKPEFFDEELNSMVRKACIKSVKYESDILDWIWEYGELDGLTKKNILDFMKNQVNTSLEQMGFEKCFDEEEISLEETDFFYKEVYGDVNEDFFSIRPTNYTVSDTSFSGEDLF